MHTRLQKFQVLDHVWRRNIWKHWKSLIQRLLLGVWKFEVWRSALLCIDPRFSLLLWSSFSVELCVNFFISLQFLSTITPAKQFLYHSFIVLLYIRFLKFYAIPSSFFYTIRNIFTFVRFLEVMLFQNRPLPILPHWIIYVVVHFLWMNSFLDKTVLWSELIGYWFYFTIYHHPFL